MATSNRALRIGSSETLAISSSGSVETTGTSGVRTVRIAVSVTAHVRIGLTPTATTDDTIVTTDAPLIVALGDGEKVSVLGTGAGIVSVTEVALSS